MVSGAGNYFPPFRAPAPRPGRPAVPRLTGPTTLPVPPNVPPSTSTVPLPVAEVEVGFVTKGCRASLWCVRCRCWRWIEPICLSRSSIANRSRDHTHQDQAKVVTAHDQVPVSEEHIAVPFERADCHASEAGESDIQMARAEYLHARSAARRVAGKENANGRKSAPSAGGNERGIGRSRVEAEKTPYRPPA